jgi:hypothetical protein
MPSSSGMLNANHSNPNQRSVSYGLAEVFMHETLPAKNNPS